MTLSNSRHQQRFIAVEGAIAAGKTTLARRLHQSLGGELELQPYKENLYLNAFYEAENEQKRDELHLLKDTAFLFHGVIDLQRILQHLNNGKTVVTDWLFEKFEIWQWTTRNEEKYRKTLHLWSQGLPGPDLVLYLRVSVDTLLQRIRSRNRPMEAGITREYLQELTEYHERFFSSYPEDRLICVSDNVSDKEQYEQLLGDIKDRLGLL